MERILSSEAQQALTFVADTALRREQEMIQYSADPAADTDEENDSDCPMIDTFYSFGGQGAIVKMKNCNEKEFCFIYGKL